jgi:hypothetical protein
LNPLLPPQREGKPYEVKPHVEGGGEGEAPKGGSSESGDLRVFFLKGTNIVFRHSKILESYFGSKL